MQKKYDAVIIGSGVIGCGVAFEMAKRGYKTLNVDKLGDAGMGSTSGSCAIIRFHYSTTEGVAMAREGYYYWLDWPKYLEKRDPDALATYRNTGALVIKTPVNKNLARVKSALDEFGVGYLEVEPEDIPQYLPNANLASYFPQKWIDDPEFGQPTADTIPGALWVPESGYISDLTVSNQYQGVVDLYDCSDDWIPIYDKSDLPGFYMAVGTSGNQYKNAPVVGTMMAELIDACEKGHDHDKDPFQFYLKYTRRNLNVGFYSRNREINTDSSFSVIG